MRSSTPDFTGKCGVVLPIFMVFIDENVQNIGVYSEKNGILAEHNPKKCTYFVLVKTKKIWKGERKRE